MSKKSIKKIAAKDADQYMLRLPPGLRDRVARRAAENGRSMNTEIVEAIEQHLTSADRVTQLWERFGKHQKNIEAIPLIWLAIEEIEDYLRRFGDDTPNVLKSLAERKWFEEATPPPITADQVQKIKTLLKEANIDEKEFLALTHMLRIEDIRSFEGTMELLESFIATRRTA
jgi:hypothetical protein